MLKESTHYFDWIRLNSPTRSYQLCADKEEILTLSWQSVRDTTAVATTPTESWLFTCTGYLLRQAVAYKHPVKRMMGTFKPVTNSQPNVLCGTLHMDTGETYKLNRAYSMRPEMIWEDPSGNPLVHFKGDFTSNSKTGEVEVANLLPAHLLRKTPFLICLGWYLIVSSHVDMALIF
jgi:hypothetical protein